MKMGYYANAQIESMYLGVPAVTHVRPEFMTPELESSGLIVSTLDNLESTLEHYLTHPEELAQKRARARSSILELHSEERLTALLMRVYGMKAPARNGLPAPNEKRIPRVLFIGNTANNAYYNAKFLRRNGAAEVDVLCNDDYWIMSSPEWEEADFTGMVDHHFYPDWKSVDLRGYDRPRWFAQGTYRTSIEYLTAYRQGDSRRAAQLWKELELERQMANARALKSKSDQSRLTWRWRLHLLRTLLTGNLWDRLFVSPLSEDFTRHCEDLLVRFSQLFPDRPDRLTIDELTAYQDKVKFLVELLPHYDIVQAYAVEPILPMLADFHPYLGFEHGTLRDAPEANWDFKGPFYPNRIGRLTALGYALADHVFITNEDCIGSAKRLDLKSYSLIPHPL
ncbi:MAG: glycosyltransferase, partial [Acidobacteriota bacterium]